MICDIIHRIVQLPFTSSMIDIDTARAKQSTLSQMKTPPMNPTYLKYNVSPNDAYPYGQDPISSSSTLPHLGDYPLSDTVVFMPNLVMSTTNSARVKIVASSLATCQQSPEWILVYTIHLLQLQPM